jgi:regulator of protease activity HflC (stomatin/prohibitin superfamily)
VLAKRKYINSVLRVKFDEVTARWGVKMTAAERERRAMIAQADGERQAAILQAEGERRAAILCVEGQAKALEFLNEATSKLGQNALLLQYLDALKAIATSPPTKIVMPLEVLAFL